MGTKRSTFGNIGLRRAKDPEITEHALRERLALITGDFAFSDIRNYPPAEYHGIVVLVPPPNATARTIAGLLDRFLRQTELVQRIPGRLTIVEPVRVRFR